MTRRSSTTCSAFQTASQTLPPDALRPAIRGRKESSIAISQDANAVNCPARIDRGRRKRISLGFAGGGRKGQALGARKGHALWGDRKGQALCRGARKGQCRGARRGQALCSVFKACKHIMGVGAPSRQRCARCWCRYRPLQCSGGRRTDDPLSPLQHQNANGSTLGKAEVAGCFRPVTVEHEPDVVVAEMCPSHMGRLATAFLPLPASLLASNVFPRLSNEFGVRATASTGSH